MARCYSRDSERNKLLAKELLKLESDNSDIDADSDSDIDYVPHVVIKSSNIDKNGAGCSKNTDDNDEEETKLDRQTSDSDSDSDADSKELLDVMTGNMNENVMRSCFSEDKLPSSFVNEVISNSSNTIVIRSSVQNLADCNKWIVEFGELTDTKWNPRDSRPCGQRFTCWKKYVCHRSKFRKVPAEKNKRGFSKNSSCLARISIKVKLRTHSTRWRDSFVMKGMRGIITIKDVHNHTFNTEVDLKYRRRVNCKEKFLQYFRDGMGVADSIRHHMDTLKLNQVPEEDLVKSYMSCSRRRVHYWYDRWRDQNPSPEPESDTTEGAGSSKITDDNDKGDGPSNKANDINEGVSTSKPVEIENESPITSGLVLSLKCLHDDDDQVNSLSGEDPSSKFININDVPELPLNNKDEPQVDSMFEIENDSEEHPNLEPVVKQPPPPSALPQSTPMILIPVVNIPGKLPIMPLRTNFEGVHKFKIKFDTSAGPKKAECAVFSESRKKLYVSKDIPFIVHVSAHNVPQGSVIRVEAVFSRPEHAMDVVTRCPTHVQQDYARGYPEYENFVQCINEGAIYEKNIKNSKRSVSIPYVKPQSGETFSSYLFKLTCFNSCVGGINRRPFSLVFGLERNKIIMGRQAIDAKVCACPTRDCKIDDDRQQKRKSKNEAPQVTQREVRRESAVDSPPKPSDSSRHLGRTQSSGSEKQKYTISVQDQELFDFLQHMKVLYEMNVQPL